jgi:hypothetical protein
VTTEYVMILNLTEDEASELADLAEKHSPDPELVKTVRLGAVPQTIDEFRSCAIVEDNE